MVGTKNYKQPDMDKNTFDPAGSLPECLKCPTDLSSAFTKSLEAPLAAKCKLTQASELYYAELFNKITKSFSERRE